MMSERGSEGKFDTRRRFRRPTAATGGGRYEERVARQSHASGTDRHDGTSRQ